MTVEELTVIGNSWGKPEGTPGVEHYWVHGVGTDRDTWTALCKMERLEKMDIFNGIPHLYLTMERNPIKQNRCDLCQAARPTFDPTIWRDGNE